MDGNQDNGAQPQPAQPRVRFGKRDTQTVPLEWAEMMLTKLATDNPATFGKLLVAAANGES